MTKQNRIVVKIKIKSKTKLKIMATNAKMGTLENPVNSELEVMRAKIRKLEATVKTKTEELLAKEAELMSKNEQLFAKNQELMSKVEELQMFKKDQIDHNEGEAQENVVVDILLVFMNNAGFKRIADKIQSFLDSESFAQCRLVSRSWRDFIDNELSMLQLQLVHLTRHPVDFDDGGKPISLLQSYQFGLNFEPLIKIMEESRNKSELRLFIKLCREWLSRISLSSHNLQLKPLFKYVVGHHRHEALKLLLDCPIQKEADNWFSFTRLFKYACQYGCEKCVKLILDRSDDKEIEWNQIEENYVDDEHIYEYDHCLVAAHCNKSFEKEVLDLLLRSAEEKGIDIHVKSVFPDGELTLRDMIIQDFKENLNAEIEDYTEETYKILEIDPLVDLKREEVARSLDKCCVS